MCFHLFPLLTVFYIYPHLASYTISLTNQNCADHCHLIFHNQICLKYFCTFLHHQQIKKILLKFLQTSAKSLIKMINNNGPKTVPCGIPLRTLFEKDNTPFILTCCILWHKKASIHAISFLSTLYDKSLHNNRLWGTLSKAF